MLFIVTAIIGRWRLPIIGTALLLVSAPGHRQHLPVDRAALPGRAERAHRSRPPYIERNIDGHPGRLRRRRRRGDPLQRDDGRRARRPAGGRGDHREHPHHRPGPRHPHVRAARAGPPVLPVPRVPRRRPLRHRRQAPRTPSSRCASSTRTARRSQGWYNDTVVYTHGYGVVAAYGNQRASDGQPVFLESGIPGTGVLGDSVGEFEPRVYFGENSPAYSIVGAPEGSEPVELDYPAGADEDTSANAHDDVRRRRRAEARQRLQTPHLRGQVPVGADLPLGVRQRRVADPLRPQPEGPRRQGRPVPHARQRSVPGDRRRPHRVDRRRLHDDGELPVLERAVAVRRRSPTPTSRSRRCPFDDINYIRNSVKATVDAYDGAVTLYAWDDERSDPADLAEGLPVHGRADGAR